MIVIPIAPLIEPVNQLSFAYNMVIFVSLMYLFEILPGKRVWIDAIIEIQKIILMVASTMLLVLIISS